jgi:hypothetical protein
MKVAKTILAIAFGLSSNCLAQTDLMVTIDKQAGQIDADKGLNKKQFSANEVYNRIFDGGGQIDVYLKGERLVKIEESIGLSYGLATTIIYLKDGQPIKIIDREENYKMKDDQSGLDYAKLNQVFEASIYVVNWDRDDSKIMRKGEREFSEGVCSNFDYQPLIESVKKLLMRR